MSEIVIDHRDNEAVGDDGGSSGAARLAGAALMVLLLVGVGVVVVGGGAVWWLTSGPEDPISSMPVDVPGTEPGEDGEEPATPEPVEAAPKPEPAKAAPRPAPKPEPAKAAPRPEPVPAAPKATPEPEPEPAAPKPEPEPVTPEPAAPEPVTPEPAAPAPGGDPHAPATLSVQGDLPVFLEGDQGRFRGGDSLPPGSYKVHTDFGDGMVWTGQRAAVLPGSTVTVACSADPAGCTVD